MPRTAPIQPIDPRHPQPRHVQRAVAILEEGGLVSYPTDTYYAIGTGEQEAKGQTLGKIFPVIQSADFVQWQFASSAMVRPDPSLGAHFWAPEVVQADGKFYLYYSVGHDDQQHQLRVAISDSLSGNQPSDRLPRKYSAVPVCRPAK